MQKGSSCGPWILFVRSRPLGGLPHFTALFGVFVIVAHTSSFSFSPLIAFVCLMLNGVPVSPL